jgi:hypothetical protein
MLSPERHGGRRVRDTRKNTSETVMTIMASVSRVPGLPLGLGPAGEVYSYVVVDCVCVGRG